MTEAKAAKTELGTTTTTGMAWGKLIAGLILLTWPLIAYAALGGTLSNVSSGLRGYVEIAGGVLLLASVALGILTLREPIKQLVYTKDELDEAAHKKQLRTNARNLIHARFEKTITSKNLDDLDDLMDEMGY